MRRSGSRAFTVIELLTVTAIIMILAAMILSSAYIARQRADRAKTVAETQQIASAVRALWISGDDTARNTLASCFDNADGVELSEATLQASGLLGSKTGGKTQPLLEIPPDRMENGKYCDPWGNPYRVKMEKESAAETEPEIFQVSVSFMNRERYYMAGEGLDQ